MDHNQIILTCNYNLFVDHPQVRSINVQNNGTITVQCCLDDISPSSSRCEPLVNRFIEGQFEFPNGTKLVSTVHDISVSELPADPHRFEIQHCVKVETQAQANCLQFVRAPSFPTILPYQFTRIEGGQFNPGNRYGVIDITCESPCLLAIVADQKQQLQETTHTLGKTINFTL